MSQVNNSAPITGDQVVGIAGHSHGYEENIGRIRSSLDHRQACISSASLRRSRCVSFLGF
jgi:hypothetical protein